MTFALEMKICKMHLPKSQPNTLTFFDNVFYAYKSEIAVLSKGSKHHLRLQKITSTS